MLIPCYNEEFTISKVIDDFRRELPDAEIYVFGNCNVRTSEISQEKKPRLLKKKTGGGVCDSIDDQ